MASDFSKRSFWDWVNGAVFTPMRGVELKIVREEGSPFRPTSSCAECVMRWNHSGLEEVVGRVKWDGLVHRKDIEALVGILLVCLLCIIIFKRFFLFRTPDSDH